MFADLHTHTTASDGELHPEALVQYARDIGIEMLSITDHDTTAAYNLITTENHKKTPVIIPGIEFSTLWQKLEIHILGLNIDPDNEIIKQGIIKQAQYRYERAERIARKLQKLGLDSPMEGAKEIAKGNNIGRPHFARYMVQTGFVSNMEQAFSTYLSVGKKAYCKQVWSGMEDIIDWIVTSGGTAVLAHPYKYKLTRTKLLALIQDFKRCGGKGIEVISGKQTQDITDQLAKLCIQQDLLASCGSDFHQTNQPWSNLGKFPDIPKSCIPVWDSW